LKVVLSKYTLNLQVNLNHVTLLDTFLDVELFNFTQFLNIMQLGCLFWNLCNFLKWSAVMVDGITKYPMILQDILIAFGSLNIFLQKN